jgi:hypothetical protein
MSTEKPEEFEALEDQSWIARAEAGEKSGFIGVEESEAFIQAILNDETPATP